MFHFRNDSREPSPLSSGTREDALTDRQAVHLGQPDIHGEGGGLDRLRGAGAGAPGGDLDSDFGTGGQLGGDLGLAKKEGVACKWPSGTGWPPSANRPPCKLIAWTGSMLIMLVGTQM